jgi:histidinol phosphatase-like enzyme (inositol monophosphatase family)
MNKPSLSDLLDLAVEAAFLGGKRTLAFFNSDVEVETKADNTPVTRADREAEEIIRRRIARTYPDHAVIGEEYGTKEGADAYRWIIDPIDGTKSFVHGVPLFAVLIGIEVAGKPSVGAAYFPALDQMIAAATGLGCRCNGRVVGVSSVSELSEATLLTTSVATCMRRSDAYEVLADRVKLVRTWGDAYGYFLVATGKAEIMLDPVIAPWDCAAIMPVMEESGGSFATWQGEKTIWGPDGFASNGALFDQVLAALKGEKRRG